MSFFEKLKLNIEESKPAALEPEKTKKPKRAKKAAKAEKPAEEMKDSPKKSPKKWLAGQDQKFGELAIDAYETEDELVVQAPVAGVKPEELEISVEDNMLVITGERPPATTVTEGQNFILQECYWGLFTRRFVLPVEVDETKIKASLEHGILTIRMPKIEGKRKKKIAIEEKE